MRVAYIDEIEEPSKDRSKKVNPKAYYSTLVKAALPNSHSTEPGQNLDQVRRKCEIICHNYYSLCFNFCPTFF